MNSTDILLDRLVASIKSRNSTQINYQVGSELIQHTPTGAICIASRIFAIHEALDERDYLYFVHSLHAESIIKILKGMIHDAQSPTFYHMYNTGTIHFLDAVAAHEDNLNLNVLGTEELAMCAAFMYNDMDKTARFFSKVNTNSLSLHAVHYAHFSRVTGLFDITQSGQNDIKAWILAEGAIDQCKKIYTTNNEMSCIQFLLLFDKLDNILLSGCNPAEEGHRNIADMTDVIDVMESRLRSFAMEVIQALSLAQDDDLEIFGITNSSSGRSSISRRIKDITSVLIRLDISDSAKREFATRIVKKVLSCKYKDIVAECAKDVILRVNPFINIEDVCSSVKPSKIDPLIRYYNDPKSLLPHIAKKKLGVLLSNSFEL